MPEIVWVGIATNTVDSRAVVTAVFGISRKAVDVAMEQRLLYMWTEHTDDRKLYKTFEKFKDSWELEYHCGPVRTIENEE